MSFSVREVGENDLENLMNWRMSPEVTDFLFTDCYLTIEGQKKWFYSLKERKDQIRWMVDVDGIPAGTIYLESIDYTKKRTSWGYFIGVKTLRSIQLAVALELSLYDYVFNKMGFEEIYCEVFSFNTGVIKLHKLCGCMVAKVVEEEVEKNGKIYDVTHMSINRKQWELCRAKYVYERIDFK